jgi:hypothetical protein
MWNEEGKAVLAATRKMAVCALLLILTMTKKTIRRSGPLCRVHACNGTAFALVARGQQGNCDGCIGIR